MQGFSTAKAVKTITISPDQFDYIVELVCGGKLYVEFIALGDECGVVGDEVKCSCGGDCLWNQKLEIEK